MELNSTPKIRFPEFADQWHKVPLSKLLVESKKRNFESRFSREDVLSVSGEFGIVNQIKHLGRSYAGESILNYHVVETGDFVYTKSPLKTNPYGIIKLNRETDGIVSTLYAVYKVNESRCYGLFLEYYFSLDDRVNKYLRPLVRKGAKNDMKINNADVLADHISVPGLKEQQKIAALFSAVDERIGQLARKKELLLRYKKAVMQQIFNQKIRFKDDNGNRFPDWESRRLGELTFRAETRNRQQQGLPVYSISNKYGFVPQSEQFDGLNSESRGYDTTQYKIIENNTWAYNPARINVGSIGYSGEIGKVLVSSLYVCFKTSDALDDSYLGQYFETHQFYKDVLRNVEGGVREYLFYNNFSRIFVPVPSLSEQSKIAKFLASIDAKIRIVEHQLEKNKCFKKGLQQQMFV